MIQTDAIVLGLSKHSDKAMRLHAYTRSNGYISMLVYGAGGRKHSVGLYMPMTELNLIIDTPTARPMRLREKNLISSHTYTPLRQIVALTIAEVIMRTMREPIADESVYTLVRNTAAMIETEDEKEIVPRFLVALSHCLGYGGQMLDEWSQLSSLSMYHELIP